MVITGHDETSLCCSRRHLKNRYPATPIAYGDPFSLIATSSITGVHKLVDWVSSIIFCTSGAVAGATEENC